MENENKKPQAKAAPEQDINQLMAVRREKLKTLQEAGQDPFTLTKYEQNAYSADLQEEYKDLPAESETERTVMLAGRMMSERVMGKASFAHLRDDKGDIQIFARRDVMGDEPYAAFKKLDIGDILISKDALHHDMDTTIFGYQLGEVPQMGFREFVADERLAKLAKEACEKVNPEITAIFGRVVSGDQFISENAVKEKLIREFQGDCAEMEGASIAHGAYLNHIPFVIIRAISDKADNSAEMDYPTFERAAAKHSAALVEELVKNI